MANEPVKKNIFNAAIDALSSRDEKAAADAARAEAEAAKAELDKAKAAMDAAQKTAADLRAQLAQMQQKAQTDQAQQAQMIEQARKAADADRAALEAQRVALEAEKAQFQAEKAAMEAEKAAASKAAEEQAAAAAAVPPAIKHVWTREDTYASLAQKYYGKFTEPYWRLIYEHNRAIIGNHPNAIRVGLEIEIPPLPEELGGQKKENEQSGRANVQGAKQL
jgi:chromosome segregation ATPase